VLNGYLPLLRLDEGIRQHERFSTFQHAVLPLPARHLETLAKLLRPHPAWSAGLSGQWTSEQVADWVQALGNTPRQELQLASPAQRFLWATTIRETITRLPETIWTADCLRPNMQSSSNASPLGMKRRTLRGAQFSSVLLCGISKQWEMRGRISHAACLNVNGVRLLSAAGAWRIPGNLTLVRNGVHPESVVSIKLEPALAHFRWAKDAARVAATEIALSMAR